MTLESSHLSSNSTVSWSCDLEQVTSMPQFSHLPNGTTYHRDCKCTTHIVRTAWVLALALVTASDTISGGLGADCLAPPASLPGSHLTKKTTLFSFLSPEPACEVQSSPKEGCSRHGIRAASDHPGGMPDRGQDQRVDSHRTQRAWCPGNVQFRGSGASHLLQPQGVGTSGTLLALQTRPTQRDSRKKI